MLNASPAAQNLVASYNGGKVSAQGMATAQNMAKTSTIGLTIAQTALNAAIGMGIGLLINLVVQGVNKLIHANEEAIESAKKLREEYEEFKSTNASNVSTLKGLEEEFKELSKGVSQYGDNISLTTEQYERYKEIIQQIVGMSPSLAEGYDTENGYIADKNGLLERAIELQEIEYQNELRKITNLQNLKTSMAGYIAEYKEAFEGGFVTEDMSAISTEKATDFSNALYQAFNFSERYDGGYESEDLAREILKSLGYDDIDKEMEKFFNENGYYQSSWFFSEYADEIANNIDAVTNALSFEGVGLDEDEFENRILTLKDCAQAYLDMKDSISMANESIQTDLKYIAEYADGYDSLSSEQQKFVNEFLKGFNIDDITSRDWFGNLTYDEDKMKSVKRQINDFIETLSQDETTKDALADLYAIPTDEQSIGEFVEQFRSALEIIKAYCEENGIEIPIAITNSEEAINELEAQQQRAVDFAKDKFNGYDPTAFFKENSINTQEEVDKWLEIAQAANSAADAEERYVQSSTPNNDTISFTDTISQVQSLTEGLDKLDQIYADVLDKESFDWSSILNNKGFKKTFGGLGAAYDDFIKTISNSPNDIDACQSAFDNLATAYIQNSDALSDLTEETKQASVAMLEEMGIKNAEEVVTSILIQKEEELAAQKILAANSTYTLTNLTTAEIDRLLAEGIVTEQTSKQLAIFALQKQLSNNYRIETQEDVNRIYNLAQMAGIGAEALAKFAQFKNDLENETDPRTRSWIVKSINEYKATLFSELNEVKNSKFEIPEVSYGGGSATKSALDKANKAAEDNKVKFKEILDKYLELYKAELDAGLIDFKTFLNKSRSLLDEYYRDGKISGKEYWDYIGNLQKEQLSVYDKVLSAVTKLYDDEIDKINDIIDGLEKQNDALKDQLEQYDNVLGVVDKVYESEIDRIREQQDAIDETISKLQDENDEKQRAIELEKARYQLYRALNNRTVKLYNGKEYIYTHDREEVRDAQQNLADLELEETVAGLEKEKEALNEVIAELEKYREMWKEISSAKEDEEYKQLAIAIWGKDYEKIILSNRITDIDSFKDKYIHIQQQIEDNQGLIDSYNEKIEYYEALKEAWNSVATAREESINREMAAQTLGANWENDVLNGRMDVLNNFKNMYIATQQSIVDAAWNAANAQIAALNAVKAAESTKSQTSGGSSGSVSGGTQNKPNKPNKKPSHSNSGGGHSNRPSMEKYGTGTDSAKPGTHIVAEDGKEIIRTNDGEMILAENEQPFRFEGGETVINNSETTTLLENLGNYKPVDFAEFTGSYGNKFKIRQTDLTALFDLSMNRINTSLHNSTPVRNDNTSSINIGDIHLHEVQNVDGLAKAIIRELPGKVNQAMYGR